MKTIRTGLIALAVVIILIVALGYYVRIQPARYNEVLGLDEFYFLRVSKLFIDSGLVLPDVDLMRNYPFGDRQWDYRLQIALPGYLYVMLNLFLQTDFKSFAIIYPAILAIIAIIAGYFAGAEMFRSKWAGIFTAFFLAVLPGMLTRTVAGGIEKEASAFPFIFLSLWMFTRAYNRKSWVAGILAGVFTGLIGSVWGGVQYFYVLFALFGLILLLINQENDRVTMSVLPTILIGIIIPQLQAFHPGPNSAGVGPTIGIAAIILIRYAAERFKLLKKEQLPYLVPGMVVAGVAVLLIGAIVSDFFSSIIKNVSDLLTLYGPQATTVAESIAGDWNAIYSQVSPLYGNHLVQPLAFLSPFFSPWLYMFIGAILLGVRIVRRRDWLMLLPLIWFISGIFSVFYAIRLVYIFAPSAVLLSAYTLDWVVRHSNKFDVGPAALKPKLFFGSGVVCILFGLWFVLFSPLSAVATLASGIALLGLGLALKKPVLVAVLTQNGERKYSILFIPVVLFLAFSLVLSAANGLAYAGSLGPSINEPFYQAMDYLRTQTPANASVISWWDFGYWFQTVGERPSIADGGGAGETSRKDLALWFTANADNWTDWDWFIKQKLNVGYILMDFTLPGKFGAITKIQSDGQRILGFIQFAPQPSNTIPRGNITILEYRTDGPYSLLIPLRDGDIADSPQILVSQGEIVGSQTYVNDLCTTQGIIRLPPKQPSLPGCIALTSMGLFFVPAEAEFTIFSRLMFMDGAGLPLDKVFDNQLIKIYKVRYENESNPGAGVYV